MGFVRFSFLLCMLTLIRKSFSLQVKMRRSLAETQYKQFRKHPALFDDPFDPDWLHPDMIAITKAFEAAPDDKDPETIIPDKLKVEMSEVYSFNVFNQDFLKMFNEEIENFYCKSEEHDIPVRRPNSMNNYGVIVNEIGMRPLITSFQQDYLWPIAKILFPVQASQFDDHHSFIVRYRADEDLGLDMHTDDSDVTFNACLGDEFKGATLSFCGMMGQADHRKHMHTYHHTIGRAILHLGSRRHGADDIASGRRSNLIVWNHNWKYRASDEYKHTLYEKEEGPPDLVCLSYTHDRDYSAFKPFPEGKQKGRPWCPPIPFEYDEYDKLVRKKEVDGKGKSDSPYK